MTRKPQSAPPGAGRLSARFRNTNIILFGLAFGVMAAVMASAFNKVIKKVSSDYADSYALGAANALSANIVKELGLFVTVSIGVTTGRVAYPQTWAAYLKRADKALYQSKHNGRSQYTFLDFAAAGTD